MTNGKVSISLPRELLQRLEKQAKGRGWTRSRAVQYAIEQWVRSLERDRRIARHVAGYLRNPEDENENAGLLKAWAKGLPKEDWS